MPTKERTDDGKKAQTLSGSQAEALEALVLGIAEAAYTASKLASEQWEVGETAEPIGIYREQNASSARDCLCGMPTGCSVLCMECGAMRSAE